MLVIWGWLGVDNVQAAAAAGRMQELVDEVARLSTEFGILTGTRPFPPVHRRARHGPTAPRPHGRRGASDSGHGIVTAQRPQAPMRDQETT